jgi:hypothetical protein
METKAFSMQSPEAIAKQYGGNKQKIAQAMQMGIIDPTAGTLAGMFIDRMRSAAQAEQKPQQTVAQQVMAPQPQAAPPVPPMGAPAGLGATPQAASMGPPPTMGQPSASPPGMAMGGMVPPYASGGLTDLPIPDAMFDEPNNGGYASGGIVAFAHGAEGEVKTPEQLAAEAEQDRINADAAANGIPVIGLRKVPELNTTYMAGTAFRAPEKLGGLRNDILGNLDAFSEAAPRKTKRAEELEAILEKQRSPEERKKSKKEDMWAALGQIGAKMATTPGSLLQAASAGIGEALPGITAAAKERRGEERALTRELLAEERVGNKEVEARAGVALDMLKGYNSLEQAFQDMNFKNTLTRLGINADIVKAKIMAGAGIQGALISAAASRDVGGMDLQARKGAFFTNTYNDFKTGAATDPEYLKIVKSYGPNAGQQYLYDKTQKVTDRVYGSGAVDLGSY